MSGKPDIAGAQPAASRSRPRFSLLFWVALALLAVAGVVVLVPGSVRIIDQVRRIDLETSQILQAIRTYKSEFGSLPAEDSHVVFRALRGQNPRQIVFFECPAQSISPDGDLLDPWGTPYKLYASGDEVIIRSAGPNRRFDSSGDKDFDDYIR